MWTLLKVQQKGRAIELQLRSFPVWIFNSLKSQSSVRWTFSEPFLICEFFTVLQGASKYSDWEVEVCIIICKSYSSFCSGHIISIDQREFLLLYSWWKFSEFQLGFPMNILCAPALHTIVKRPVWSYIVYSSISRTSSCCHNFIILTATVIIPAC